MPDLNSSAGIEFMKSVVTSQIPTDDELRDIVCRLQTHHHTSSCYKQNDSNICRFGFPRPVSDATKILDQQPARNSGPMALFQTPSTGSDAALLERNPSNTLCPCNGFYPVK
ncbi:hypothetical protein ABEB36_015669 [Hypothenemus hampei]|uniref:Uncharacterized protein n=1 Tax=Hypothenemus hampei TaxID=57062 RepID=A0ABD1DZ64_HYPHA